MKIGKRKLGKNPLSAATGFGGMLLPLAVRCAIPGFALCGCPPPPLLLRRRTDSRFRSIPPKPFGSFCRGDFSFPITSFSPVLLIIIFLFACNASAGETSEEVLKRIEAVYGAAGDLTAEFVQKTSLEDFGERTARGTLYLKKDRMARWDYRTPTKQKIYVSGNRIVLYDPEAKRAVVQTVSGNPDAEPALGLLSRVDTWRTLYELRFLPEAASGPGPQISFELIPRKKDRVEKIRITAERETGLIVRLTLHEKEGARVAFEFSGTRLNQGLKIDLFEFTIPRGVEVLEVPR